MPKNVNHEITDDMVAEIKRYLQTASPAYDKFGNAVTLTAGDQVGRPGYPSAQPVAGGSYGFTTVASPPSYAACTRVISDGCTRLKLDVDMILAWLYADINTVTAYIEQRGDVKGIPDEIRDTLHDLSPTYPESAKEMMLSDYKTFLEGYIKFFENIMNGFMIMMRGKSLDEIKKEYK